MHRVLCPRLPRGTVTSTSPPEDLGRSTVKHLGPVLLAVALGMLILLVAAIEEPYNIDELRQTRSYDKSFEHVVQESILQEQPPLDPLINAMAQRVIGVGDVRQRLLSVLFGVGSLVTIAVLSLRSRLSSMGAATVVAMMSVTPLLVSVTAYARPYALPIFLMLSFLLASDTWLAKGTWQNLSALTFIALMLPLSRTVEPVIFLVLIVLAMAVMALRRESERWRVAAVAIAAFLGLGVAAAVQVQMAEALSDRVGNEALFERLGRFLTDLPMTLGSALPFWPLILIVVGMVGAIPEARAWLMRIWWWWILAATAIGFAGAFLVVAPTSQPFFDRYVFSWVPSIAVLVGLLVSVAQRQVSGRTRVMANLALSVTITLLGWASWGTAQALTKPTGSDWKAVSRVLAEDIPGDTALVFDPVRQLGLYRTPFAGHPRYTGTQRQVPLTLHIIRGIARLEPGDNTVIVLLTPTRLDVPGWIPISIDGFFTVYIPESPRPGLEGAAMASEEFSNSLEPSEGAALRLTAAALWMQAGDTERASGLLTSLMSEPHLHSVVLETIEGSDLEVLVAR